MGGGAHEAIEAVGEEAAEVDTREIDSPEGGKPQGTEGLGRLFSTWENTWIKPSW